MLFVLACDAEERPLPPFGGPGDDVTPPPWAPPTLLIPTGAFMMGCNPALVSPCDSDEMPYHAVSLSTYEIDRIETTQYAYARCVEAGACTPPADSRHWDPIDLGDAPVVGVTWAQADAFCRWMGKRLPTEAEWERAARGDDGRLWPWGNETPTCTRANFGACGEVLREAGALLDGSAPRGALDMAGNALEWVADWYDADAYAARADGRTADPAGPAEGVARVLRGGHWKSDERSLRTSYRGAFAPDVALETSGVRCARTLQTGPSVD
jgi:formylglycine-generating enzyme required for sulfatase activity